MWTTATKHSNGILILLLFFLWTFLCAALAVGWLLFQVHTKHADNEQTVPL